jgi:hypothetical protein
MNKELFLVATIYVADDWYGQHYRYFVANEDGKPFSTRTEANKYAGKLKKFIKKRMNLKSTSGIDISVGLKDSYEQYRYCGAGPSLYYTHIDVNLDYIKLYLKQK